VPQHILPGSNKTGAVSIEDLAAQWGRIPIYTPEFVADPRRQYREMRARYRTLAPVELAPGLNSTLVIDYRTAVAVLNDFEHFSADPRAWQQTLTDAQRRSWDIYPMVEWRPNALRSNGPEHDRYRAATSAALARIDQLGVRRLVTRTAISTINTFCQDGRADLLSQYCSPVTFEVIATILGCTPALATHLAAASAALFDGRDTANQMFDEALRELTRRKRTNPGADIASWLVQHEARLDDDEMVHQLLTIVSAAVEIPTNLAANTLLLILTQPHRFTASTVNSLPCTTGAAIDETLITNTPMANYCVVYPRQPQRVGNIWLPPHQPVVTSMAAINDSPEINTGRYFDNRSHVAFGTGPHACPHPARRIALWMVEDVVDELLDRLPEMRLEVPESQLTWRPGPLHRALTALPVTFPATAPFALL